MFFTKNNTRSIIRSNYKAMMKTIKKSNYSQNAEFELLPVMLTAGKLATVISDVNNGSFDTDFIRESKELVSNFDDTAFTERLQFYIDIINGNDVRGEWCLGDITSLSANPLYRCIIAFGDILFNPDCVNDYYNTPKVIYGVAQCLTFTHKVMEPLFTKMIKYSGDLYKYFESQKQNQLAI